MDRSARPGCGVLRVSVGGGDGGIMATCIFIEPQDRYDILQWSI